jgi:hypothetical protein
VAYAVQTTIASLVSSGPSNEELVALVDQQIARRWIDRQLLA